MLSKRSRIGVGFWGARIKLCWGGCAGAGGGTRGFIYSQTVSRPKVPASDGGRYKSSAPHQVAEEFFDAGLLARVILLGNRAGLFAQFQAKNIFLQRIEVGVDGFLDRFDARLQLRAFRGFFRGHWRSIFLLRSSHHDNFFERKQRGAKCEERNQPDQHWPFQIVNARGSDVHLLPLRARIPFLTLLLPLSIPRSRGLRRADTGNRDSERRFGGQRVV